MLNEALLLLISKSPYKIFTSRDKSSRAQMFFKIGVLKNFAIFTRKLSF